MPTPWQNESQDETVGKFQLKKKIGAGAYGTVYRAFDTELHRDVALKFPSAEFAPDSEEWQRFLIEARAAAKLEHPHICPVYHIETDPARPYIVMSFVEGQSLRELIEQRGKLTPIEVQSLVAKLASALANAHAGGVVHRDLKPDNIMIRVENGEPVVMDFGMARIAANDSSLTAKGQVMGTPAFMSPEQAAGRTEDIGPASDIYSLGVVMYQALTGSLPFEGAVHVVVTKIVHNEPPPPSAVYSSVHPGLEQICLKAMAKEIDGRYSSMNELLASVTMLSIAATESNILETVDAVSISQLDSTKVASSPVPEVDTATNPLPTVAMPPLDETSPTVETAETNSQERRTFTASLQAMGCSVTVALGVASALLISVPAFLFISPTGDARRETVNTSKSETPLVKEKIGKTTDPPPEFNPETERELLAALGEFKQQQDEVSIAARPPAPMARSKRFSLQEAQLQPDLADTRDKVLSFRAKGDEENESKLLLNFSNDLLDRGETDLAADVAERMVELAGNDTARVPFAYGQLGRVRMEQGDPAAAIPNYERAQKTYRELYNKMNRLPSGPRTKPLQSHIAKMLGINLNRLGNAHKALKQYVKAETAYLEALRILRPHDDRKSELQLVLSNYGSLLSRRGDSEVGIKSISESVSLARELKDTAAEAEALVNLGNALSRFNRNSESLKAFQKAEVVMGDTPDYRLHTTLLYNWILTLVEEQDYAAAREKLKQLKRAGRESDTQSQQLIERFEPLLDEI